MQEAHRPCSKTHSCRIRKWHQQLQGLASFNPFVITLCVVTAMTAFYGSGSSTSSVLACLKAAVVLVRPATCHSLVSGVPPQA
jgi:hypothetical protein